MRALPASRFAAVFAATLALVASPLLAGVARAAPSRGAPGHTASEWDWRATPDQKYARFGSSLATGDVNCDGYQDLIVGAPLYLVNGKPTGAVYVYDGSSSGLEGTPSWVEIGTKANSYLGGAVASTDTNADGCDDVIIGVSSFSNDRGEVLVYDGSSHGPTASPSWTRKGDLGFSEFGLSLSTLGSDLIIGAPDTAQVELYRGGAGGLHNHPAWTFTSPDAGSLAGFSVAAIPGGFPEVAVGGPDWNQGNGEVTVLRASDGSPQFKVRAGTANEYLGQSVAGGDVNGDGWGDVLIGGPANLQSTKPRVLLYEGSATGIHGPAAWRSSWTDDSYYGLSVGLVDLNHDNFADVVIGAPAKDNGRGWAFVYLGSTSGPHTDPDWDAEGDQAKSYFGWSLAGGWIDHQCCQRSLAIGAPDYSGKGGQLQLEGAAYAFYQVPRS